MLISTAFCTHTAFQLATLTTLSGWLLTSRLFSRFVIGLWCLISHFLVSLFGFIRLRSVARTVTTTGLLWLVLTFVVAVVRRVITGVIS